MSLILNKFYVKENRTGLGQQIKPKLKVHFFSLIPNLSNNDTSGLYARSPPHPSWDWEFCNSIFQLSCFLEKTTQITLTAFLFFPICSHV